MAITNYEKNAILAKKQIFNRSDISKENKKHLEKFLEAYDVSPAREAIFFKHIGFLLAKTKDIKKDMHNRDRINSLFKSLREELSSAYLCTIINVSLAFVRWLNDGDKPKGFKDVKNRPRKDQRRDLKADDMLTWKDGLKLADATPSMQIKALILLQLDGGLRPSELVELNYGSIKRDGKFLIVHVDKGKTGSRDVILFKSVPYVNRWLQMHPTKKADSPFWIMEHPHKSTRSNGKKIMRYEYRIINKKLKLLSQRAGIKKPVDLYNFRHSACTISKLENISPDLAAEKFGHTVDYYVNTYGRLDVNGKVSRFKKAYGEKVDKIIKNIDKPVMCNICDTVNMPNSELCEKCGNPLSLKKAIEIKKDKDSELTSIKDEMARMNKILTAMACEQKIKAMS